MRKTFGMNRHQKAALRETYRAMARAMPGGRHLNGEYIEEGSPVIQHQSDLASIETQPP